MASCILQVGLSNCSCRTIGHKPHHCVFAVYCVYIGFGTLGQDFYDLFSQYIAALFLKCEKMKLIHKCGTPVTEKTRKCEINLKLVSPKSVNTAEYIIASIRFANSNNARWSLKI